MRAEGSVVIVDSSNMSEEELDNYAEAMNIAATFYVNETEGGEE